MVPRRRWIWALAAVVLVGVAGVAVVTGVQRSRHGEVHNGGTTTVAVERSHRFSLAVPDRGASVGDHWTAAVAPDGVVTLVRSEQAAGNLLDRLIGPNIGGGAGTRYFVFDARRPGSATITLHNCFQGCGDDRTRSESRDVTWTVTVR
ncbi:protease inhibitor I42 family protein [Planosporangium flavigriseum]|uniref:Proteinase inhibitor I42 chagasin domain-containing protein n=1 Tax=Planosporangium flavigriseum TaxID=373681 RepID=A0A8J3LXS2_9ACTN|nr:protease inhibitor I42 family protein [Planosporangium flavigriseum]NJC67082.1 protease inhibitor I42 family protein [Planosporangium flavigriseum]GIG75486.1 hypothetical protein Pfl04_38900 [Planosporangium flavigriseum]